MGGAVKCTISGLPPAIALKYVQRLSLLLIERMVCAAIIEPAARINRQDLTKVLFIMAVSAGHAQHPADHSRTVFSLGK